MAIRHTLRIVLALSLIVATLAACGEDADKQPNTPVNNSQNGSTPNSTSPNGGTEDAGNSGNAGNADAGTTDDAGADDDAGGSCEAAEAFDAPLDTCVTCPNTAYDCEGFLALYDFDNTTGIVTVTPAAGDASIVTATLGVRVYMDGGMSSTEYTVDGTLDGRDMTFDVSDYLESESFQIYSFAMEDTCGDTFEGTFVANYQTGGVEQREPFCPLGG